MKKKLLISVVTLLMAGVGLSQTRDILIGSGPGGGMPPSSAYQDSWALLIAINNYRYVPDLKYAVADAEAMKRCLATSAGFPGNHIFTLYNEKATMGNIKTAIGTTLPKRVGPNDRVLIFFAGHGQTESLPGGGQMGYLIPVEGRHDNLYGTCLSMSVIHETSKRLPSKHTFYIVDACYSGIAGVETRAVPYSDPSLYLRKLISQKAVQIITAGQANETVVEGSQFGGGHSVFTYALLNGISQGNADLNGDGIIPASELFSYLAPRITRDSGGHQTPKIFNMEGDGEFVFFTRPTAKGPAPAQDLTPPAVSGNVYAPSPSVSSGHAQKMEKYSEIFQGLNIDQIVEKSMIESSGFYSQAIGTGSTAKFYLLGIINAPVDIVWEVLTDVDKYPRFRSDIYSLSLLKQSPDKVVIQSMTKNKTITSDIYFNHYAHEMFSRDMEVKAITLAETPSSALRGYKVEQVSGHKTKLIIVQKGDGKLKKLSKDIEKEFKAFKKRAETIAR